MSTIRVFISQVHERKCRLHGIFNITWLKQKDTVSVAQCVPWLVKRTYDPRGASEEYNRTVLDLSVVISVWLSELLRSIGASRGQGGSHSRPPELDVILQSTVSHVLGLVM